jgi:hypothetical protein
MLVTQPGAVPTEPIWPGSAPVCSVRTLAAPTVMDTAENIAEPARANLHAKPKEVLTSLIQQIPVCIAWKKSWAGELGKSMLFHVRTLSARSFRVGYFAYWTTERPWGDNALTHWLLPALVIDAFYSHLLFVFPGLQAAIYGPGDVEGVRVTYQLDDEGRVVPVAIIADDETHQEVALDTNDAVDEGRRVVLLNDIWSHQLSGRRAVAAVRAGASHQCFSGAALQPLTERLAHSFRLGSADNARRAGPAWGI